MSNSPKKQQQRKDGSPHKLTYNEKTVANAKGDYLSVSDYCKYLYISHKHLLARSHW